MFLMLTGEVVPVTVVEMSRVDPPLKPLVGFGGWREEKDGR